MKILALRAQSGGYRGCLIHEGEYRFFTLSRNGRLRQLMSYPVKDYHDHDHFLSIMLKYILPATIFQPPAAVEAITPVELDRILHE